MYAHTLQINQSRFDEGNLTEVLIVQEDTVLLVTWHDNGQLKISRRTMGKPYDIDSIEGLLYEDKEVSNLRN